jgi:PST family polysaccharide transporter
MAWMTASHGIRSFFDIGVSIALARLLFPEDSGVVGMVLVFLQLSWVVGNFGMGLAIVQRREITRRHIDTSFALSTLAGAILAVIFVAAAPLAAAFYDCPRVTGVMRVLSLQIFLSGMAATGAGLLQRELRFREVGLIAIAQSVVNGVIAVTLAFHGFGVWSLAWGPVASALFYCIAANTAARYLPRPRIDRAAFRDLLSFGSAITVKNVFVYISCHADLLIIGKFLGEASLGLYTKAFSLSSHSRCWHPIL